MKPLNDNQDRALRVVHEHGESGVQYFPVLHTQGVMRSTLRSLERRGLVCMERDTTTRCTQRGRDLIEHPMEDNDL